MQSSIGDVNCYRNIICLATLQETGHDIIMDVVKQWSLWRYDPKKYKSWRYKSVMILADLWSLDTSDLFTNILPYNTRNKSAIYHGCSVF